MTNPNTMRKVKLLFLIFILTTVNAISQNSDLIYIRIQEKFAGAAFESYMRITYTDQTSKLIELNKMGYGGSGAEENGKIIQKEVGILLNQGYEIASTSTGCNEGFSTTIIFLTRKKEK